MTGERDPRADELACIELTDMLSAYLDGEVSPEQRRRIDEHLKGCAGCRAAVEQFRTVIRLSGRLTPEDVASVDPLVRDRLLATLQIPRRR
jgi:anti-sigma factor RsiW